MASACLWLYQILLLCIIQLEGTFFLTITFHNLPSFSWNAIGLNPYLRPPNWNATLDPLDPAELDADIVDLRRFSIDPLFFPLDGMVFCRFSEESRFTVVIDWDWRRGNELVLPMLMGRRFTSASVLRPGKKVVFEGLLLLVNISIMVILFPLLVILFPLSY